MAMGTVNSAERMFKKGTTRNRIHSSNAKLVTASGVHGMFKVQRAQARDHRGTARSRSS
jgi:hypothetical protein